MFTNLIGFIKPLLRKDRTARPTARTRPIAEDEPAPRDDREATEFETLVEVDIQTGTDPDRAETVTESHDEVALSIEALKHLIESSDHDAESKKEAWLILNDLERQGHRTFPFDAEAPIIDQLRSYRQKNI